MQRKKAVTLTDIAREVGVSAMTVSAVLNGSNSTVRVSEQTRMRVREAAQKLQYRANAVARGLSSRRMNTIGVIAEFNHPGDMNLHLHQLLNGILEGCVVLGQKTTIYPIKYWSIEEKNVLGFCDGLVDGFILLAPHLTDEVAARLFRASPVVAIHSTGALGGTTNIDIDSENGAMAMTNYLIDAGHRRIAHVTGAPQRSGSEERLRGYRKALEAGGIDFDQDLVVRGYYTVQSGMRAGLDLISRFGKDRLPTAVFAASDSMAYGVIDSFLSNGVSVPGDVSVVGFDDAPIAHLTGVELTTIRQPLTTMGVYAVSLLLKAIDESAGGQGQMPELSGSPNRATHEAEFKKIKTVANTELFAPSLVVRESVAAPRSI